MNHYQKLILDGTIGIRAASRMPSLRKCAAGTESQPYHDRECLSPARRRRLYYCPGPERLLCDRYRITRSQVQPKPRQMPPCRRSGTISPPSALTSESFRFDLWQRYIKSALRQNDTHFSPTESRRGKTDLRQVLADYVRQRSQCGLFGRGYCDRSRCAESSAASLSSYCVKDRSRILSNILLLFREVLFFQDYGFEIHHQR